MFNFKIIKKIDNKYLNLFFNEYHQKELRKWAKRAKLIIFDKNVFNLFEFLSEILVFSKHANFSRLQVNSDMPYTCQINSTDFDDYLLHIILLPFYVYANKINRQRDEKAVVFPITNYFYKMVKITFIPSLLTHIIGFIDYFLLPSGDKPFYWKLLNFISFCSLFAFHINNTVFHVLIMMMTLVKFLVYFFPSTEKCSLSVQSFFHKNLKLVYLTLTIKDLIIRYSIGDRNAHKRLYRISYITYYGFNVLLLISALLYIPILINIRKHSYLPSFQEHHPQRYIFWQTIVVFIFKSVSFFLVIDFRQIGKSKNCRSSNFRQIGIPANCGFAHFFWKLCKFYEHI
nr:hypothetical protein Y47G7B.11 - Caenorhabditis elegans [Caenorhabditis elegans]